MTRAGALYLAAGQSSGVAHAILRSEPRDTASQLSAARALRLGGTAGRLPPSYFAAAPAPFPPIPHSAIRTPHSP